MSQQRSNCVRQWNVRASSFSRNTRNLIREIIEDLKIQPNPNKSFIPLSVGDPSKFGNLRPPAEVFDAVRESVCLKESRSYGPLIGHYEARKAVAEYSRFQEEISPDDIIISSGCTHAIDLVMTTLAEAGQNVLVPRPGYVIQGEGLGIEMRHYDLLNFCKAWTARLQTNVSTEVTLLVGNRVDGGSKPNYMMALVEGGVFPTKVTSAETLFATVRSMLKEEPKENWKVDLKSMESKIDENTVAIVVNNPSNPCGSVYSKEHLCEILDVAARNYLPIIADEIYEHFVFSDGEFVPIASLSKHVPVFTCSGLTKKFLIPGWRLGWVIVCDRNGIVGKDIRKALSNMSSRILGASTLIQQALPRILKCAKHKYFSDMMLFIESQAKIACNELQKAPGLRPVMPQGSMYMMIEIKVSIFPKFKNELQFIKQMCAEQSVLCLPGLCFNYPGFMRIVLTVPQEVLIEACGRIIEFCIQHVNNTPDELNHLHVDKLATLVV